MSIIRITQFIFFNDGTPGKKAMPISTPLGALGVEICFDCDYEDVSRKLVRNGAQILIAPTFDAAHWGMVQHEQHARFFQLRAAENKKWMINSATSGISQLIDPNGHVHKSLPFEAVGTFTGKVELLQGRTIYNLIGWILPWISIFLSVIMSIQAYRCKEEKSQDGERSIS